jgi:uncharacterized protein YgiM (DUF1202 family)
MMFRVVSASALLICLVACNTQSTDPVTTAYIAPATVNLRSELSTKNNTVAVLKHGERVEIVDVRRRFIQIRSAGGKTGWVDSTQLLSQDQMQALQAEHRHALTLPSEGSATVFEALNVHLEPSRQSPAFTRIPESSSVEVLEHKLLAKAIGPAKGPVFTLERPQPAHRERKKKEGKQVFRLPPKPAPPKPPANIDELSAAHVDRPKPEPPKVQEPAKPVTMEDWSLIRTKDKLTGWVLSRNMVMSIPDEVAQYAEGKRITSYFSLGEVHDDESGTVKHNWLWTTLSQPADYDFDSWRVFLWNRRRHRYETSYRLRDVEGYFPVHVDGAEFSVITRDDDNRVRRRTYSFDGVRVHLTNTEDYRAEGTATATTQAKATPEKFKAPGWFTRLWNRLRGQR